MPRALRMPTVRQLQWVIDSLEAEVGKRRSAEEQLADTQQSLAVTLARIGASLMATDHEGRVTRMNAVAERITGWARGDAQGQVIRNVFDRVDRPLADRARKPVEVLIEQGIGVETLRRVVANARDGTRRHAHCGGGQPRSPTRPTARCAAWQ